MEIVVKKITENIIVESEDVTWHYFNDEKEYTKWKKEEDEKVDKFNKDTYTYGVRKNYYDVYKVTDILNLKLSELKDFKLKDLLFVIKLAETYA